MKIKRILCFSVITLLLLSTYTSIVVSSNFTNNYSKKEIVLSANKGNSIKVKVLSSSNSNFNTCEILSMDGTANITENILVTGEEGNESYPSMVFGGSNALVAYEHRDEGNSRIFLRNSQTFGKTWSSAVELNIKDDLQSKLFVNSPALCISKNTAYGIFLSPIKNSGIYGIFTLSNIMNLASYSYSIVDFTDLVNESGHYLGNFWNYSEPDIVFQSIPGAPWIAGFIGTTNYTDDTGAWGAKDTLMFSFRNDTDPNPDNIWIQWDNKIENLSNISLTTDSVSKKIFGVCEISNGTNQDLLFFLGHYIHETGEDPYLDIQYNYFNDSDDLRHPTIFVNDDGILISAEITSGGINDIIIFNSSDNGSTWNKMDPTGSYQSENFVLKNPFVQINESGIICVYTENNTLFFTIKNNSDSYWADRIKVNSVNNSVVDEYRSSLMPDNKHIVWTDKRKENNSDIYISIFDYPDTDIKLVEGSAILYPEFVFGRINLSSNMLKFIVKNDGATDVYNMDVNIVYNFLGTKSQIIEHSEIDTLLAGTQTNFTWHLFNMYFDEFLPALKKYSGIQNITITLQIPVELKDINYDDNTITFNVLYKDIFPRLFWLEKFFT